MIIGERGGVMGLHLDNDGSFRKSVRSLRGDPRNRRCGHRVIDAGHHHGLDHQKGMIPSWEA